MVLTQKVADLGEKGEVLNIKDGYGRNYLLPNGLAVLLSDPRAKQLVQEAKEQGEREQSEKAAAEKKSREIEGNELVVRVKIGDKKQLFSAISEELLKQEIMKQWQVEAKELQMSPIKELGVFNITVKLGFGVSAGIKIKVEGDK